jgi:DNA-directed RNA polymerase subunit RPC12/RpoP
LIPDVAVQGRLTVKVRCARCGADHESAEPLKGDAAPRCGACGFLLWVEADYSSPEYCGKCATEGGVDWKALQDDQDKERQRRARAYSEDLKRLSDSELMGFEFDLLQQMLEEEKRNRLGYHLADPALYIAVSSEVHRREFAAGWFWRRWRRPFEYQKWVAHREQMERIASEIALEVISRTQPSTVSDSE